MKEENKDVVLTEEVIEDEGVNEDQEVILEEEDEFVEIRKGKRKPSISKIMNVVLWVVLFAWIAICFFDFVTVKGNHDPKFCISKKTTTYSDGKVESCTGLGYKVYRYDRESFSGLEFGPFWSKDRTAQDK